MRSELRHSNFLGWLFDPSANHGLGDAIVRRFLQRAMIASYATTAMPAMELDLLDFSDLEVFRERWNIDLLLISQSSKLVIVIENKIEASESPKQLLTYRTRVQSEFPESVENGGWRHIFLFLTLSGDSPEGDGQFIPVSYTHIIDILSTLLANRRQSISNDVAFTVSHYVQMMRRNLMEDSELKKLARRLYAKHKLALDFIFEQRPDNWADLRNLLISKLNDEKKLNVDPSTDKSIRVRFFPDEWIEFSHHLDHGTGWQSAGSTKLILCEIEPDTKRERVRFKLILGPGEPAQRNAIISAFEAEGVFKGKSYPVWTSMCVTSWRQIHDEALDQPEGGQHQVWADVERFLKEKAPRIQKAFQSAFEVL